MRLQSLLRHIVLVFHILVVRQSRREADNGQTCGLVWSKAEGPPGLDRKLGSMRQWWGSSDGLLGDRSEGQAVWSRQRIGSEACRSTSEHVGGAVAFSDLNKQSARPVIAAPVVKEARPVIGALNWKPIPWTQDDKPQSKKQLRLVLGAFVLILSNLSWTSPASAKGSSPVWHLHPTPARHYVREWEPVYMLQAPLPMLTIFLAKGEARIDLKSALAMR